MRKIAIASLIVAALTAAACGSSSPQSVDSRANASHGQPVEGMTLRFGQLTERTIDIDADGRNTTAAIAGMNAFALDLYLDVAADESQNLVLSPYSVSFALSMIYAGANGRTAAEMEAVLHAAGAGEGWHEGINAYDLTLDARTAGSPTTWTAANKVWTQEGLSLTAAYLDQLTGSYGSPIAVADFASDAEKERLVINDWIAQQTTDLIPELFPQGSLPGSTAMVLVNAVAMDAPWEFPFDPAATTNEPFTRLDGSTIDVPTMHYDEFLPSATTADYQAVEIPYGGGALSMVVIQPNDLPAFEQSLTLDKLDAIVELITEGGIHLSIPKWSDRTHITLNDTLANLGMASAFDGTADFSGMTEGGGLTLDRVEHEAFIEVDEQGTRAAAATGGSMVLSHGPTVTINQPFFYVIRDRGAGTILFIGRVVEPSLVP